MRPTFHYAIKTYAKGKPSGTYVDAIGSRKQGKHHQAIDLSVFYLGVTSIIGSLKQGKHHQGMDLSVFYLGGTSINHSENTQAYIQPTNTENVQAAG